MKETWGVAWRKQKGWPALQGSQIDIIDQAVSDRRFASKRFSQVNDERCWHVRERSPSKCCNLPISDALYFAEKSAKRAVTSGWRALTDVHLSSFNCENRLFANRLLDTTWIEGGSRPFCQTTNISCPNFSASGFHDVMRGQLDNLHPLREEVWKLNHWNSTWCYRHSSKKWTRWHSTLNP